MTASKRGKFKKMRKKTCGPITPRPEFCEIPGCIRKVTAADHCHDTGRFRGWLCGPCNSALGIFGDTSLSLRAGALAYLEATEARPPVEIRKPQKRETIADRISGIDFPKIDLSVFGDAR